MPLFRNTEPDLRAIIAYIVARARDRGITLNQTKLVKLLYLLDLDRVASRAKPLTGLNWIFFHYGPYALELPETLTKMEGTELITQRYGDSTLYRAAPDAPSGDDWISPIQRSVNRVTDRFAPMELNELLDHVYFQTAPMIGAVRGETLDLRRELEDPLPRRHPPLMPAPRPAAAQERLEKWQESRRSRLMPTDLTPSGQFFDDPPDDVAADGIRGRLRVTDETDF